jgi:hypothetical protein
MLVEAPPKPGECTDSALLGLRLGVTHGLVVDGVAPATQPSLRTSFPRSNWFRAY